MTDQNKTGEIVDQVQRRETERGIAPEADYTLSLNDAVKNYTESSDAEETLRKAEEDIRKKAQRDEEKRKKREALNKPTTRSSVRKKVTNNIFDIAEQIKNGREGLGNITEVSKGTFDKWLNSSGRKMKPFAEYKGIAESKEAEPIEKVNARFNEQLGTLTEKNADSILFSLGKPSAVLRSAGVENKPMKLYGNKVMKKMRKHGFALEELRDLPRAVAEPIAVFNNYGEDGNRSILTEMRTKQGNFLVSVNIGKDADVDFNIVRSIFGKGDENVVGWINKGLATYINKKKALTFLSRQSAPIAATAANAELSSAVKIVKDFVNPSVSDENVAGEGKTLLDVDEIHPSPRIGTEISKSAPSSNEAAGTRYSLRTKPAPKKTQKVYKLMRLGEDGKPITAIRHSCCKGNNRMVTGWL